MGDDRIATLNAVLLAAMVMLSLAARVPGTRAVVPASIEWRHAGVALSCPPDLPTDCIILWGP